MHRKLNQVSTGIQPPQLPSLSQAADLPHGKLTTGAAYTQLALSNCNLTGQSADSLLFEQMTFRRVNLSQTHLNGVRLVDARFDTCSLAGLEAEKGHLRRIEFRGCQLLGAKWLESTFVDVRWIDCRIDLALFWSSSFKAVRFEHCSLSQASFEGADLSGAVFRDCDLSQADLRSAQLNGTDFRGSIMTDVQLDSSKLHGAIIDPAQAVAFVGLLGVVVKEREEARD